MSKYVECRIDITAKEFTDAALKLKYEIGNKVKMYQKVYDVDVSATDLVGLQGNKLLFDSMYQSHANKIVEQIYTNRLTKHFGHSLNITKEETRDAIYLHIKR